MWLPSCILTGVATFQRQRWQDWHFFWTRPFGKSFCDPFACPDASFGWESSVFSKLFARNLAHLAVPRLARFPVVG